MIKRFSKTVITFLACGLLFTGVSLAQQKSDSSKDEKVYQDMMDYNVISDKPGTCPLCGMTLKEVSLKKAKEILLKSGFKVEE
jgi:hypothetical protein